MSDAVLAQLPFALSYLRQAGCDRAAEALLLELSQKYPDLLLGEEEGDDETEDGTSRGDSERVSDVAGSSRRGTSDAGDAVATAGTSSNLRSHSTGHPGTSTSGTSVLSPERAASIFKASVPPWGQELDEYDSMDDVGYRRRAVLGKERDNFIENELDLGSEEGSEAGGGTGGGPGGEEDGADSQGGSDEEHEAMFQPMPAAAPVVPAAPPSPTKPQQGQGKAATTPPPITPMPAVFAQYMASSSSRQATASPSSSGTLPQVPQQGSGTPATAGDGGAASSEPEWDKGPADIKLVDPVTTPRKERGTEEEPGAKLVLSRVESLSSSFKDFDLDDDDQALGIAIGRCSRQPSEVATDRGEGGSGRLAGDAIVIQFSPPGVGASGAQPSLSADTLDLFSHSRGSAGGQSGGDGRGGNQSGVLEEAAERTLEFFARASGAGSMSGKAGLQGPNSSSSSADLAASAGAGFVLDAASPTGASIAALASMPFAEDAAVSPTGAFMPALEIGSLTVGTVILPAGVSNSLRSGPVFAGLGGVAVKDGKADGKLCVHKSEEPKEAHGGFSFPVTPSAEDTDSKLFKSWPSVRSSSMSELAPNMDDVSATCADYADDGYRSKLSSRTPSQKETRDTGTAPGSHCSTPSPRGQQHQQLTLAKTRDGISAAGSSSGGGTAQQGDMGDRGAGGGAGPGSDGSAATAGAAAGGPRRASAADDTRAASAGAAGQTPASSSASLPKALKGQGSGSKLGSESLSRSTSRPAPEPEVEDAGDRAAPPPPHTSGSEQERGHQGDAALSDGGAAASDDAMDWQDPAGEEEEEGEEGEEPDAADGDPEAAQELLPKYTVDESGAILYQYDPEYIHKKYEVFNLQVIHRRHHTGFEETKDFPIRMNDLIAGRYQVVDFLGSAAFSRAVQAVDVKTNALVCLKIVKNSKDYLDQSLDEIKLLKYVNMHDPHDSHGIVRLYDYFYYKEHLFLVCELLRANLYEFQKYNKESGEELYFTNARIQKIAISVLKSLAFLHALDLIHSDLKPENILIKSYSRCEVKVIDLGSSCFTTDQLSSYVQSRSYRAPEVILGLPYDTKVDIWSLGCILAELSSGYVLFQNDSVATLLARLEGILGRVPDSMLAKGRYAHRFYTRSGQLFEHMQPPQSAAFGTSPSSQHSSKQRQSSGADPRFTDRYELLTPKKSSLRHRVPDADDGLLAFIAFLLGVDPSKRPTAAEALRHPWLQHRYPNLDC